MRHVISLVVILWLGLVVGCGGGSAEAGGGVGGGPGGGETPEAPLVPIAEPQGPTGSAAAGANCDFGGSERLTCSSGLICCYPEQGEVNYGTCVESCPGYD